jgi:hypothetical protein
MTWWKPWTWQADPKWTLLSNMPSVQVRLLSLIVLDFVTFAGVQHTIETIQHNPAAAHETVNVLWGMWFGFLGGLHGFGYAAYKQKRQTAADGNISEDTGATVEMEVPVKLPVNPPPNAPVDIGTKPALAPRPDLGVPDKGVV